MRSPNLIIFAFGFCAATFFGQSNANERTYGFLNGRGWAACDTSSKTAYLAGMLDGWNQRMELADSTAANVLLALNGGTSFANQVDLTNSGYKNPANIDLPVSWVLMAELAIKRGDTSPDLVFTNLRQLLNRMQSTNGTIYESDPEYSPVVAVTRASKAFKQEK